MTPQKLTMISSSTLYLGLHQGQWQGLLGQQHRARCRRHVYSYRGYKVPWYVEQQVALALAESGGLRTHCIALDGPYWTRHADRIVVGWIRLPQEPSNRCVGPVARSSLLSLICSIVNYLLTFYICESAICRVGMNGNKLTGSLRGSPLTSGAYSQSFRTLGTYVWWEGLSAE
jgi:hypothetical protein